MSVEWTDAEREAVGRALADTEGLPWGEPGDVREQARQSYLSDAATILAVLAPHVEARAAQAAAKGEERATDEYDALLTLQSDLLEATVNVLRGDPPELTQWSHHDVADRAQRLKSERDQLAETLRLRSTDVLAARLSRQKGAALDVIAGAEMDDECDIDDVLVAVREALEQTP